MANATVATSVGGRASSQTAIIAAGALNTVSVSLVVAKTISAV